MKFSFTLFKKLRSGGRTGLFTDANIIFGGVLFLMIVFLALVAVDAYLFYTVRGRESEILPPPAPPAAVTPQEIDEAIKLIDRRAQEYQALLNPK